MGFLWRSEGSEAVGGRLLELESKWERWGPVLRCRRLYVRLELRQSLGWMKGGNRTDDAVRDDRAARATVTAEEVMDGIECEGWIETNDLEVIFSQDVLTCLFSRAPSGCGCGVWTRGVYRWDCTDTKLEEPTFVYSRIAIFIRLLLHLCLFSFPSGQHELEIWQSGVWLR